MKKKAGLGDRIRERLQALGYWKDGRPDVLRFCEERRYNHVYIYRYLKDSTPEWDNLDRLAHDLGATPEWILYGDVIFERNAPAKLPSRRAARARNPTERRVAPVEEPDPVSAPPLAVAPRGRTSKRYYVNAAGCCPHPWGLSLADSLPAAA